MAAKALDVSSIGRPVTKEISVIIVSYNVRDFLQQCLRSLEKASEGLSVEVIVVENASRDASAQMVREQFPWVRLIENKSNRGFSRANNQAIRIAQGRYLLLINPDTLAREDTLTALLDFMEAHPAAGVAGCKILNPDGTLQLSCRRSFPTPWVALSKILGLSRLFPNSRLFGKYNLTYLDPDRVAEVDALSGSFLFLRRQALEKIGLFDEEYFMYGEDLDLCYRIKRAGWKIYYVPLTQIIHYKGKSTQSSASTVVDFYRAMYIFVKKHLRHRYLFFLHWFLVLGITMRAAISFAGQFIRRSFPVMLDVLLVNVALLAAILLRFGSFISLPPFGNLFSYLLIHGIGTLIWVASFWALGLYDRRRDSLIQAFWAVTLGFLLISTLTYFKKEYAFSRIVILTSYVLNLILIVGWRGLFRLFAKTAMGQSLTFRRAVVVGADKAGASIADRLRGRLDLGSRVVGFIRSHPGQRASSLSGLPILGDMRDLADIVERQKIHEIIVTSSSQSYANILELVSACATYRVHVKLVPSPYEVMIGGAQIDHIDDIPLVEIRYRPLLPWNRVVKRIGDASIAFLLLILTALPASLWALFHRLRPDRYRYAERIIGERSDRPLRWRTRQIEVPKSGRRLWFRRFHYRWALDNWPLLISVLKGDVSLVGPEPREGRSPRASVVKPGLTGFVQIHHHEHLTPEEVDELEIYYLRSQSLMLDMQILLKSLWRIVRFGGAGHMGSVRMMAGSQETQQSSFIDGGERIEDERIRSRI
jgi:GT2 family glycosyltransferase/lipopolysaccharide/colanic/teichoic acid biosynthesis glycosyltransferase